MLPGRGGERWPPAMRDVDELVTTVIKVSGKTINIKHVDGPVGVQSWNFSNARIYSLGWRAKVFLKEGIGYTYPWIEAQVKAAHGGEIRLMLSFAGSPKGREGESRGKTGWTTMSLIN